MSFDNKLFVVDMTGFYGPAIAVMEDISVKLPYRAWTRLLQNDGRCTSGCGRKTVPTGDVRAHRLLMNASIPTGLSTISAVGR